MLPVVPATDAAVEAVHRLVRINGGLMFVLSAGCCDGSAPMCFPVGDFLVGTDDIEVGSVAGCPLYVERRQLEAWPHAEIVLDVEPGTPTGSRWQRGTTSISSPSPRAAAAGPRPRAA